MKYQRIYKPKREIDDLNGFDDLMASICLICLLGIAVLIAVVLN